MRRRGGAAMDWLRGAFAAMMARELSRRWRDAGEALLALLQDEAALASIPPGAAWDLVQGVLESVRSAEAAVRRAQAHALPPKARWATGELLYALAEVRDVVERYVVPEAERRFGPPPGPSRPEPAS